MTKTPIRNPAKDIPHYLGVFQTYLGSRMYIVFALTLAAVLAEGVGILMLLPLLSGLDSSTAAEALPTTTAGDLVHGFLAGLGLADSTVAVLLIITLAFLIKGTLTFGALGFSAYLRGQLLRELKSNLLKHYCRMGYGYYSSRNTGHFINVINEQINLMLMAFNNFILLGSQLVNTLIYLVLAFVVAWRFGLMALVIGIVLLVVFRWLNVYVLGLSRKSARENSRLIKLLIQPLHAFKYLISTNQMPQLQRRILDSIRRLTGYEIRRGIASAFTGAVREPLAVVFMMVIVLIQVVFLKQPLAPILVSIILFYRGFNATMSIQARWQNALDCIGSVEMVRDEFKLQQEHEAPDGDRLATSLAKSIRFENVCFNYEGTPDDVLKRVSLEIPVCNSVAFVGESGAGKSTLVDMLTLVLKPSKGRVLIDGVPGDEIQLASWRNQIGYVSQETVVFDDTVANNICLWQGDPNQDSQLMAHVREVAGQAHLAHFIDTLPQGYDTLVGDRGLRLSGGQRQRLFIARELFRKPRLLILDEATSSLDSESESAIQQSIDELKGRITVVIIAHRLSTIRNVDQVYVFDHGKLVEQGLYQELRDAEGSRFGRLAAMQSL